MELADANTGTDGAQSREQRRAWLEWSVMNYEQLAYMHQPPLGDRAIELRSSGELIGACGYNPALGPYALLPGLLPERVTRAASRLRLACSRSRPRTSARATPARPRTR